MFDAILKNWTLDTDRLTGEIFADTKGRFKDHEVVRTSPVNDIGIEDGLRIATTRSGTRYLLV